MDKRMYEYDYLMDYYPESINNVTEGQAKDRETVQAFMTGEISGELITRIASKASSLVEEKSIDVVCFAPGTTGAKTILRFGELADSLSDSLSCNVFLDGITLKFDSDPITHTRFYQCNAERIKNKNVLLIGGVYTTGQSLQEVGDLLMKNAAKEVFGLFIAKTTLA
ncbi:MAG: hypothetical protein IJ222_00795 [Bacteroidales bacterium]|nr:hypothetical protein [Bacteroidales bacterium]